MKGARARHKAELEQQKFIAWHIAALPLSKKMPSLNEFIGLKPQPKSPDHMLAIARLWHSETEKVSNK